MCVYGSRHIWPYSKYSNDLLGFIHTSEFHTNKCVLIEMQVYAREKHNTHRGMNSYYPIELVLLSSICIMNYYKTSMSVLMYTKYFYIIKYYITPATFLLEASRIPFSIFLTTIFQSQTSGFFCKSSCG